MDSSLACQLGLVGILLLAGVLSNRLSSRFNMPILLMFLGVGMVVGHFAVFDKAMSPKPVNDLGTVAMCFILFSGGLSTRFRSIKPIWGPGLILATGGVLLTAVLLGFCIHLFQMALTVKCSFAWCMLLASLISSTDAAAMFAILRGRGVSIKGELQPLLELESGSNDPMAALLTLFLIPIVLGGDSSGNFDWWALPLLLYKLVMGAAVGAGVAIVGQRVFKFKLEYEGLYYVLGVALVLIGYGGAEGLKSNGFLAVYVLGLVMGNLRYNYRSGLTRFNEGLAWLMQVLMFTSLGMLVDPSELIKPRVYVPGILLSAALMFIARPGAVFCCLVRSKFSFREKLLISWAGLRGAAPIVLATFPLACGVIYAQEMFNTIFFIVISSVLFQGMTLMPFARKLKLDKPFSDRSRPPLELETMTGNGNQDMHEFTVEPGSALVGNTLAQAQLPAGILVVLLRRGEGFAAPRGNTVIQEGDGLLVLGVSAKLRELAEKFFPGADYEPDSDIDELAQEWKTSTLNRK